MEFQSLLTKAMRKFRIKEKDIEWALVTLKPKMSEQFVTEILARRGLTSTLHTSVFFATLLTPITDDDLLKAERIYDQADARVINFTGLNYRDEIHDFFREERKRRGL